MTGICVAAVGAYWHCIALAVALALAAFIADITVLVVIHQMALDVQFHNNVYGLCLQAVYKMSVAASLTKPNPLTAEECTNRIFARLDKDNNGEDCTETIPKHT